MQSIIKLAISKQTFIKLEIINLAIINDARSSATNYQTSNQSAKTQL
jgi:hypothetical protein